MRSLVPSLLVAIVSLSPGGFGPRARAEDSPQNIRIARLVRQLGSESYTDRQAADAELAALGVESRHQLELATASDNAEIKLRAVDLLRRLRVKELWSAGQVRVQAEQEPAAKVLTSLMEQTGNRVIRGDSYGTFKDDKVNLKYPEGAFWPVLDDICRQTGNHVRPHYDIREPGLVIVGGPPGKNSLAYAGPLRAQITSGRRVFIEELDHEEGKSDVTHTFQLNMQLMWEDRLQLVAFRAQPDLVEAVTDSGTKLQSVQASGNSWNVAGVGTRQLTASLRLTPPPAAAKKLDRLTIKWGLMAVGDLAALDVTDLSAKGPHSQDDVELRVEEVEERTGGRYDISVIVARDLIIPDPPEILFRENQIELFDADGKSLRAQGQSNVMVERGARFKITFAADGSQGPPKTLRLTYPKLRGQQDMEITFRNVPLPAMRPE